MPDDVKRPRQMTIEEFKVSLSKLTLPLTADEGRVYSDLYRGWNYRCCRWCGE